MRQNRCPIPRLLDLVCLESGKPMPGLLEVGLEIAIGEAIADLMLIATCSFDGEYNGQVRYLPLR